MKILTQTVALTALLTAAPLALADHDRGHRAQGGYDPTSSVQRKLTRAMKQLDLSEEQESAVRAIFEDNREDLQANREATRAVREDIRALLDSWPLDEAALASLAEREGELAEERVVLTSTLASEVLAELDEDQRAELDAMREERRERMRERFSDRGDRG